MKPCIASCVVIILLGVNAVQAQTTGVWRCGADGRSYSDTPCPQGQELMVDDARSPAQVQAAQGVAARDKRLADQLVREREAQERLAMARLAPATSGTAKAEARIKPDKHAVAKTAGPRKLKREPPADDGIWRAVAPASRHTKG